MHRAEAEDYLRRANEDGHPCKYGHLGCATHEGGLCSDELAHQYLDDEEDEQVTATTEVIPPMDPYDRFWDDVAPVLMALPTSRRDHYGWTISSTFNGCVMWSHENTDITIHATPFWEGSQGIVLQLDSADGSVQEFPTDLPYALTDDPASDADRYLATMHAFLNGYVTARLMGGQW